MALPPLRKRAQLVFERLCLRYPTIDTHLVADSPWELMIATVLAAQCTDARVNQVTPVLFSRWPTPQELSQAHQEDVEKVIYSTGFYRNKAKNIIAAAQYVVAHHNGEVPKTIAELILVPGVARKTANVVLWGGYGLNEGIAVDTHVKRIVYRLGLTKEKYPVAVERDLMKLYPPESWGTLNHMLVWFGRHICDARKPLCEQCEMLDICPQCGVAITSTASTTSTASATSTAPKRLRKKDD